MGQTIDLHLHTTASDGTDAPLALPEKLRQAGITTFAVCDHDTIDGAMELECGADLNGLRLVRGVEFSCRCEGRKCHILGYGYDPNHPALQAVLEHGRRLRLHKLEQRLDYLEHQHGIRFTAEELRWLDSLNSVGKPHLGKLLLDRGLGSDLTDVIQRYINGCPSLDDRIPAAEAIDGILRAGGIPVWAHPLGGEGERRLPPDEFRARLKLLLAASIRGLECCYSRYGREEMDLLLTAAAEYGLLVSGGSDYHGTNKNIPLGTLNTLGETVDASVLTLLTALDPH